MAAKIILYAPQLPLHRNYISRIYQHTGFSESVALAYRHFHVFLTQVVPNLGLDRFQGVCALDKKMVKCTLVQALRLCTGCMAHGGSRGIALLFLDHATRKG